MSYSNAYVRAAKYNMVSEYVEQLEKSMEELKKVLDFYATPANWDSPGWNYETGKPEASIIDNAGRYKPAMEIMRKYRHV